MAVDIPAASREPEPRLTRPTAAIACLHESIAAQASLHGHRPAVSCAGQMLTYRELDERANAIAAHLVGTGIRPDDVVGLCVERSLELIAGIVGILKAGAAYLPLDPEYPTERLSLIIGQAQPRLILGSSVAQARLPSSAAGFIDIRDTGDRTAHAPATAVTPDNLCYQIFTSGSTGTPKGVMVTHRNVARLFTTVAGMRIDGLQPGPEDTWSMFHSCAFGFSAWEIFGALLHGAHLVIVPDQARNDPRALHDVLQANRVSVLSLTPTAFRQLLLADGFSDSPGTLCLRTLVLSGEAPVAHDLARWFALHGDATPALFSSYAITETGGQVAIRRYRQADLTGGSARTIGQSLPDTPVWILDTDGRPLPPGAPGELCVGGPGVARGYVGQPELTAARFTTLMLDGAPERVYRTGDLARVLANGEIEFIGREDGQIKLHGYRIEPGDIEACLATLPGIEEVTVQMQTDAHGESRLVAYLASNEPDAFSVPLLRAHARQALPDYMVPGAWVLLRQLPRSPNGKLDRAALPAPGQTRPRLDTPWTAPQNALESALLGIWQDTLGLDGLGTRDNFFELGGDSILALKLTARLRELLGAHIYIVTLLEAPTVQQLAASLQAEFPEAAKALATGELPDTAAASRLPAVRHDPAHCHEPFPLTDVQQAYLVGRGSDFALGGVSTHLYIEVDADGLDLERLERAWQTVIDRHPMLRAIVMPDGTQRILPSTPPYRIPLLDLRSANAADVQQGLVQQRERLSHQVIPSDRWPLFELAATQLPDDRTRLHISLDCLITDARSFQIMSGELLQFYQQADTGLPVPGVTFRDYILAERELRSSELYRSALEYWRDRARTLPPMPQLPLACAPEQLQDHRFVQRGYELGATEWASFQAHAATAGVTPTAALLQCFGETLAAWSRSPDLTLNLTLFNRMPLHPDIDNVVGDFTSLVLVGVASLSDEGFEARARRLQKELWQGVDQRFVSGIQVLREIARIGGPSQAMMPIVFTSTLGIGADGQDASSWHKFGRQVFSVSQTPQVWLDHVASERDGALWLTWDAVEALFPAGLLDDMFATYTQRLHELATDPACWHQPSTSFLDHCLPARQLSVRENTNATQAPEPNCLLHAGFGARAHTDPAATAIISSDRQISYGELDSLSNCVAQRVMAAGIGRNQLVAVVMQKGWEQVVAVLGVLKAGAAYMPVDASMPTERLHHLLDVGAVRLALTQACQDAAIEWPHAVERLIVSDALLATGPSEPVVCPAQLDDIAYVIFTSGSTGLPKGVVIDHRGAVNTCDDINQRFGIGPADRVLALSSLSFDLSVYDIFGVLAAGGAIVLPDAAGLRDPSHWAQLVATHRVTLWNTVPALMDLLTEYATQQADADIQSLRTVMMSGDWIPVRLPDRIRALCNATIYSLGGATEASIWSIIYPIGTVPPGWTSIPYGKPMLNQTFHVLNQALAPCPDWVVGELYIGGIGLAKGYWRDEVRTAASFIVHPRTGKRLYRTGDLGRYLPDGNIEFLGREDFQVKIQGFRVELGDIETALESHPEVRNAVVIAAGNDRSARRLLAYYIPVPGHSPSVAHLRDWVASKLPEYMIPTGWMALDALPLSANGKVDRQRLPAIATPGPTAASPATATDSTQRRIAGVVADILQGGDLAADANLLQLGATSIEMIRIANALEQHLGFRPRMDDFYRDPSIDGLVKLAGTLGLSSTPDTDSTATRGDPLLTPAWLLEGIPKLLDPAAREAFKASRPGIRQFEAGAQAVALPPGRLPDSDYASHRSHRDFAAAPLPVAALAQLLSRLAIRTVHDREKRLYASAGGIYPVQCYLYSRSERIDGLAAGCYYYDPLTHSLIRLDDSDTEMRLIYDPLINRPIFDRSAFALFLVADLRAIGSLYRERALHYATLEAGHITQLLEMSAPLEGIGLCQTGGIESAALQDCLQLSPHHLVLHGLLGGPLGGESASAASVAEQSPASGSDRDEGEI